ncbi:AI-2E family transporter [Candidatus Woesearchaeota archaeon]|nr:AI-2E family transporter [Candidatus Woesearchaeota archaeon]
MDKEKISKYFFVIMMLSIIVLSFFIIRPFLTYILLGIILGYAFLPIYKKLSDKKKFKSLIAVLIVLLILALLVVPTIFLGNLLVKQTIQVYNTAGQTFLGTFSDRIANLFGETSRHYFENSINQFRSWLVNAIPSLVTSMLFVFIGLFVMFFVIYYMFKDGDKLSEGFKKILPMKEGHRSYFVKEMEKVTRNVIYGQLLIAIIQGLLAGIGFWLIGVPNFVFWSFLIAIVSFIPLIGPPLVWFPLGVFYLAQSSTLLGSFILIYGALVINGFDYILRPRLVSSKTKLHPLLALLGVIGGIYMFGFIGFILGPLIMSVLTVSLDVYMKEFS